MDFTPIVQDIKQAKLAARRFEKEGHGRFRDCVYVTRNGQVFFERYSYGEAASLVFRLRAAALGPDGTIQWAPGKASYQRPEEAPQKLTGYLNGAPQFDDKAALWPSAAGLRSFKLAGLGPFKMFWLRLFG